MRPPPGSDLDQRDDDQRVLWHDDAGTPELDPTRSLPAEADVVVVGAGYCGLAAARRLAAHGRSVVVVDRDPLGVGASTRSGGMVIPELHVPPDVLERRHGALGRRMWEATSDAVDRVGELAADLARHGHDCSYRRSGGLVLARTARAASRLAAQAARLGERGEDVRWIPRGSLGDEIGSDAFEGGLLVERTGGLHPARFHAGLAERALAEGAEVHDRTAVIAVDRAPGGGWRVYTSDARITCRELVVATNATVDGAFPGLRRRVLPVASFVIATEPLSEAVAAEISPRGRMFEDSAELVSYWRLSPDRRLVFGGRRDLRATTVVEARDALARQMRLVHPAAAGAAVTHWWGGYVAITLDRLPRCGRLDGLWFATGCNGTGVALMPWLGERLADAVCGAGPLPPFAGLPPRRIPLWHLRGVVVPVVGEALRLADRR